MEDQWAAVERTSKERGHDYTDLALVTDGLRAEREQGITIDVAYRYFATPKRKFIIADTPGHIQYTRNMVTGASTAQLVIVLVDARHGLLEQSRRHAFLASLLGIQHIVLAVNKMDLIDWDQSRIRGDPRRVPRLRRAPRRARRHDHPDLGAARRQRGDQVRSSRPGTRGRRCCRTSKRSTSPATATWSTCGSPFSTSSARRRASIRITAAIAGTVASGVMRPGDEVVVLPIGKTTPITAIDGPNGPVAEAFPPMAVSISLADDIDISRGDMIARTNNQPRIVAGLRRDGVLDGRQRARSPVASTSSNTPPGPPAPR